MEIIRNRKMPSDSKLTSMADSIKKLKKDESLVIFAEGDYTGDKKLGLFPLYDYVYFNREGNRIKSYYYSYDWNSHERMSDSCLRQNREIMDRLKGVFKMLEGGAC